MTGLSSLWLGAQQYLKANESKAHQKYQWSTHCAINPPSVQQPHEEQLHELRAHKDSGRFSALTAKLGSAGQGKEKKIMGLGHVPVLQRNGISVELSSWIKFSTAQPGLQESCKSYLRNRLSFRLHQWIRAYTSCNAWRWDCLQISLPNLEITFLPHSWEQNTMCVTGSWWKEF